MRDLIKNLISPWVIIGAFVISAFMVAGVVFFLNISRSSAPANPAIPVRLFKIPAVSPTAKVTPTEFVEQTPLPSTPPGNPGIAVGGLAQIIGTSGAGLNLRASPGINAPINFLGLEAEVFEVKEGPVEKDGYTWYLLVSFSDPTQSGWGVSNYLEMIKSP